MMTFAQLNYSIHEQEMLALKHCLLHKRRHHLDMQTFTIFMDNRALSSLKTNTYQGYEGACSPHARQLNTLFNALLIASNLPKAAP